MFYRVGRFLSARGWISHCSALDQNSALYTVHVQKLKWLFSHEIERGISTGCAASGNQSHNVLDAKKKEILQSGPGLGHFIANSMDSNAGLTARELKNISHPYVKVSDIDGQGRSVYFDMYGCQMNVSDAEIAWAVLRANGYRKSDVVEEADVVLVVTCSIREGAEQKVWQRLDYIQGLKKKRSMNKSKFPLKVGVLGCMAERLKHDILEKRKSVDVVAGPDSYRDLPRLLAIADSEQAVNVLLSLEETYADIVPVSLSNNNMKGFVSIMRGCDNMCSYCIVPFTRGRERSRSVKTILDEVRYLSDHGVKQVTLLGQNVNSYRDISEIPFSEYASGTETHLAKGFKTIYKPKVGGLRFADLLDEVSLIDPEMRIRFTSPHPKDFPDEVLMIIKERPNLCKNIHLPAQSGSSRILELMRRGYTREVYLDLVEHIRSVIPNISLSTDLIAGFCSETEEEFQDTLSLIRAVRYNYGFLFPYSMREKTHAHRRLKDDVPEEVKRRRHLEMNDEFLRIAGEVNSEQVGTRQLLLIEGNYKRSENHLQGRNDGNIKVVIPNVETVDLQSGISRLIQQGDYVEVQVTDAYQRTMRGTPVAITTIQKFSAVG